MPKIVKERKSVSIGIRFKPSIFEKIKELSGKENDSLSEYIENFVDKEYNKLKGVG